MLKVILNFLLPSCFLFLSLFWFMMKGVKPQNSELCLWLSSEETRLRRKWTRSRLKTFPILHFPKWNMAENLMDLHFSTQIWNYSCKKLVCWVNTCGKSEIEDHSVDWVSCSIKIWHKTDICITKHDLIWHVMFQIKTLAIKCVKYWNHNPSYYLWQRNYFESSGTMQPLRNDIASNTL